MTSSAHLLVERRASPRGETTTARSRPAQRFRQSFQVIACRGRPATRYAGPHVPYWLPLWRKTKSACRPATSEDKCEYPPYREETSSVSLHRRMREWLGFQVLEEMRRKE